MAVSNIFSNEIESAGYNWLNCTYSGGVGGIQFQGNQCDFLSLVEIEE